MNHPCGTHLIVCPTVIFSFLPRTAGTTGLVWYSFASLLAALRPMGTLPVEYHFPSLWHPVESSPKAPATGFSGSIPSTGSCAPKTRRVVVALSCHREDLFRSSSLVQKTKLVLSHFRPHQHSLVVLPSLLPCQLCSNLHKPSNAVYVMTWAIVYYSRQA